MDKEQQAKLLTEIVETNQKNGLYDIPIIQKKMTAVEWLITEIDAQFTHINIRWKEEMIDKAKQMEKEQIISAHKEGNKYNGWALRHEHEKYYNETYKP